MLYTIVLDHSSGLFSKCCHSCAVNLVGSDNKSEFISFILKWIDSALLIHSTYSVGLEIIPISDGRMPDMSKYENISDQPLLPSDARPNASAIPTPSPLSALNISPRTVKDGTLNVLQILTLKIEHLLAGTYPPCLREISSSNQLPYSAKILTGPIPSEDGGNGSKPFSSSKT